MYAFFCERTLHGLRVYKDAFTTNCREMRLGVFYSLMPAGSTAAATLSSRELDSESVAETGSAAGVGVDDAARDPANRARVGGGL